MKLFGRSFSSRFLSQKSRILSVLDVGSSKISCIIVRLTPYDKLSYLYGRTHQIEVLGFGCQRSVGIKKGVIVDLDAAEHSIRLAVDLAERMAGLIIDSLIVSLSSTLVKSELRRIKIPIPEKKITEKHLEKALSRIVYTPLSPSTHTLHVFPLKYYLEDTLSVVDPINMSAESLGIDVHVLTVDSAPLRNLELCINRAHLSVESVVTSSFSSAISCLMEDEANMGAVCIDLGADTTGVSVFMNGNIIHSDGIPIGGSHITRDIAVILSTSIQEAERLKITQGSYLTSNTDQLFSFTIKSFTAGEGYSTEEYPRSLLSNIIRARITETMEIIQSRLYRAGYGNTLRRCVVLTGGGSLLPGLVEGVQTILGGKVRLGRPLGLSSAKDIVRSAVFSSAVGLIVYPQIMQKKNSCICKLLSKDMEYSDEYLRSFSRVGKWFKKSFG